VAEEKGKATQGGIIVWRL